MILQNNVAYLYSQEYIELNKQNGTGTKEHYSLIPLPCLHKYKFTCSYVFGYLCYLINKIREM